MQLGPASDCDQARCCCVWVHHTDNFLLCRGTVLGVCDTFYDPKPEKGFLFRHHTTMSCLLVGTTIQEVKWCLDTRCFLNSLILAPEWMQLLRIWVREYLKYHFKIICVSKGAVLTSIIHSDPRSPLALIPLITSHHFSSQSYQWIKAKWLKIYFNRFHDKLSFTFFGYCYSLLYTGIVVHQFPQFKLIHTCVFALLPNYAFYINLIIQWIAVMTGYLIEMNRRI